jgi:hypothetical protein
MDASNDPETDVDGQASSTVRRASDTVALHASTEHPMNVAIPVPDPRESPTDGPGSLRPQTVGIAIAAAGLLSILMMAHHPSVSTHAMTDVVSEISTKAPTSKVVHGALIGLVACLIYAFTEFSVRLELRRPLVRGALMAFVMGSAAMIGAALISGFLVSSIASVYAHARADDLEAMRHLLNLSSLANRTLANFGVVAISGAILLWSIALLLAKQRHLWLGVLGLIAGAAPVVLIALDVLRLDVPGMTFVVAAQTVWYVAVGLALALGKV